MKTIITILCLSVINTAMAQHILNIPDTLSGTTFNLAIHPDSVQFVKGNMTQTFGVNGSKYLGPTLIMYKGDSVQITVNNNMGDTTTMHWHGLHVAPKNDGGPFSMIMNGSSWSPKFVIRNNASTYWYHPHLMKKTAQQAIKGDMGLIIVRDKAEAALALPRRYGIDDFPIIVQSVELDTLNRFMPKGMVDSIVLVNGTDSAYVKMPAQVVRLRLLNASGERTFNFGFTANKIFNVISNDDGLLTKPVSTTRIRLSPGERAEILLDLTGKNGQSIQLMSYASELPIGVQGGPTMPMPKGSPAMNSPLNGIDFNVLQINVKPQTSLAITTIPTMLVADTPYLESEANITRTIHMTADSMMVMDGPFYFNHQLFNMSRVNYKIPINNTEIWTLLDSTMVGHPFHIHDVYFYILDRNGKAPATTEKGRKDVVLIQPNEKVRIIMQFKDFVDTTIPYMYHCHILMHEDDGMMGQFMVGASYTPSKDISISPNNLLVYPNPCHDMIHIKTPPIPNAQIKVYDMLGNMLYSGTLENSKSMSTALWPKGLYNMLILTGNASTHKSFIVQ